MKRCKHCYPNKQKVREIIEGFRDSEPTVVQIKDIIHIAYKVLPGSDMWQTWCTIEFSMEKKKTHPKVGFDIGIESVEVIGRIPEDDQQFRDSRFTWTFIMPKREEVFCDESSLRVPVSTKEILCYLKFGKCDPRTMEIYERLKSKEETE